MIKSQELTPRVRRDLARSIHWLRKAANQGNHNAQLQLARFYIRGEGMEEDRAAAIELAEKAAEQGNLEAQKLVGYFYVRGDGVPADVEKGVEWMREAAMAGDTETQFFLGMIYAGFDVRLMSVDDASELPAEGARLVVVAEVDNDHLHLRIFDPDGELVADRAEPELPNKAVELDELRRQFATLQEAAQWTTDQRRRILNQVTSIIGHTFYAGAVLDPLKAYKWLQIAAEEGDERAAHLKNEVTMQLSASELSQGIREAIRLRRKIERNP